MKQICIRNYREKDFNNYLEFIIDSNRLDLSDIRVTPLVLDENLNHPTRDPEKDIFIAEEKGKIIGYCEIYPEIQINRALVDALVHPTYRRQRIASALIEKAMARSAALGAHCIHVDIQELNAPAKNFLKSQGFTNVRRYLNMTLDLKRTENDIPLDNEFYIRPCRQGEEKLLCEIQNYCFKESWGFKPNTEDEVRYLINTCECSPEDVIFCFQDNQPVGYCWTKIIPKENKRQDVKKGRIHMLGVDPDYRGSGLGRIALVEGIRQLKSKGIQVVELTTDSMNQPAYELYLSVGFEYKSTILWFEKQLN